MKGIVHQFWLEEDGQDFIEYVLILGFISLAVIAFIGAAAPGVNNITNNANDTLNTAR